MQQVVRPPAVAGMFYSEQAAQLMRDIERFLAQAESGAPETPKAIIAPHAGYIYSGPIAAQAYAQLAAARGRIDRVVLLGPCHRVPVRGLALPDVAAFLTPLGRVPIDTEAIESITDLPQVLRSSAAHAMEHSLEVQLPFLQTVLGDFKLVPLAVGWTTADDVAEVLERLWGGPETLIVISSDLSHYHHYDEAREMDRETCSAILNFDPQIDHEHACGATPIAGFLLAAKAHDLHAELLDLRSSGDTAGDRNHVVGYAAFAFREGVGAKAQAADLEVDGASMLQLARRGVEAAVRGEDATIPADEWLKMPAATFVTIMKEGELRGCIGSIEPTRPLGQDLVHNARGAALYDPRFTPISIQELEAIDIEVSLLSMPQPLEFHDEADLHRQLRPGVDGLILNCEGRHATFLPQVWGQLREPAAFVDELKRKAGLSAATPIQRCSLARYTVRKWREGDLKEV